MARVVGVDVTRGLAVLGMFAAHVGAAGPDLWSGTGLLGLADGRSAATFAFLAGVSAALLSGGVTPPSGRAMTWARVRVLARAVLLIPLGAVLVLLPAPIAIILPGYAVMFALVALTLSWPRWALLAGAVVLAAVGPVLVQSAAPTVGSEPPVPWDPVGLLLGHYYPAVVWTAYLLVGLAVGRCDLRTTTTAVRLVAVGVPCAVLGYGVPTLLLNHGHVTGTARALLDVEPHADTGPEALGNVGVALVVLGLALLAGRAVPRLLAPLGATGALALTVYTAQVVVIAVLGPAVVRDSHNEVLVGFVLVTLVITTLWRAVLGRGPLERALHSASTAIADAVLPRAAPDLSDPHEDLAVRHEEPPVRG